MHTCTNTSKHTQEHTRTTARVRARLPASPPAAQASGRPGCPSPAPQRLSSPRGARRTAREARHGMAGGSNLDQCGTFLPCSAGRSRVRSCSPESRFKSARAPQSGARSSRQPARAASLKTPRRGRRRRARGPYSWPRTATRTRRRRLRRRRASTPSPAARSGIARVQGARHGAARRRGR